MNPRNFKRHVQACHSKNQKIKQIELENNEILDEEFEESEIINEGSSDLFENEFLKKYQLIINIRHHLLICKICKYVLEEDSVFNHLSRNHRLFIDCSNIKQEKKNEFVEELNLLYPMINSNFTIETEEIIQGIKVYNGYCCNSCNYLSVSKKGIKNHLRQNHPTQSNLDFYECNIQTLFLQPDKRRYFRVKKISRLPNQVETIERECIERIFARTNSNNRGDQLRTGHQFVSSFHTEANWNYVFDKFNNEEIDNIVGMQVDKKLEESMGKIFDQGEKFSKVVNHHFNQLIDNPLSK